MSLDFESIHRNVYDKFTRKWHPCLPFTALHRYSECSTNGNRLCLREKIKDCRGIKIKFLIQEKIDRQDEQLQIDNIEEIDNSKNAEINTNFTNYLADESTGGQREPFYCKQLGFAMEKIRDGFNLKDLWEVIPSQ